MMFLARREFGKVARTYRVHATPPWWRAKRVRCWTFKSFGNLGIAVLAPSIQEAHTALQSVEDDAIQELTK